MSRLENKIALITGAGSGIGRACALALARNGARVSLVGRRKNLLEEVAKQIGDSALVLAGDIRRKPSTDPAYSLTIYNTAAGHHGLSVGLVW